MVGTIRRLGWLAAAAVLCIGVGCGEVGEPDEGTAGTGGGGSGGMGGEASIDPITWSPCPDQGPRISCAEIGVPLDWSDPSSERIRYFVRKVPTSVAPRGQLWMLQGGPGHSGAGLVPYASYFTALGFDVYIPDHRGTGRSTPLVCVGEERKEMTLACEAEIVERFGDDLRHFSTTGAALDIGKAIEATRAAGEKVYVYGVSYGTFLLNRYLTLFPDQADGAIYDSACSASGCTLYVDRAIDTVAKTVFDACGEDELCSSRLSSDPWAKLAALQDKLDAGHCPAFSRQWGRYALSMVLTETVLDRRLVPAALASAYRLDRCTPEDATAVRYLLDRIAPGAGYALATSAPRSGFLHMNITFSEFWRDLTPELLIEDMEGRVVAPGYAWTVIDMLQSWSAPLYETPAELYRWAAPSAPVLVLNGTLDTQTPIAELDDMREAFSRGGQSFVEVPWGAHGAILEGRPSGGFPTCGIKLIADFLRNPKGTLDTSCLDGLEVLDFEGSESDAMSFFGTSDLWENLPGHPLAAPPDPEIEAALDRAAERSAQPPMWSR